MAMVNVRENLETLVAKSQFYGCERQLILSGSRPLLTNPYVSYGDRVLIDFRIALNPEETDMTVAKLCEKFDGLNFIKFPEGNIEYLKNSFNGRKFFMVVYHVYTINEGFNLYNRLKDTYFSMT